MSWWTRDWHSLWRWGTAAAGRVRGDVPAEELGAGCFSAMGDGWAALGGIGRGLVFGLIAWLAASEVLSAADNEGAPGNRCDVCSGTFTNGNSYVYRDRVRDVKKFACEACSELKTVCWACRVPAHGKTLLQLDDERVLCDQDARTAILDEREARELFAEVKREVLSHLMEWRPRPETNFSVYLVSRDDFVRELRRKPVVDHSEHLLGLTRSEPVESIGFDHFVYLLTGIPREEFKAVCAHEYTHAWLAEHSTRARVLNPDTEEGFCELMAWKYATAAEDKVLAARILESDYTHGQVNSLVTAEEMFGFYRLVKWILNGIDGWLDKRSPNRVLALREDGPDPEPVPVRWIQPVPTVVPSNLVLKGISGGPRNRFALINDRTLAAGERGKVRVGATNLSVKCVEIRDRSAVFQVDGQSQAIELRLPEPR